MAQKNVGLEVVAITSPFQVSNGSQEEIDGIIYLRTSQNQRESISDLRKSFSERAFRFFKIFRFYFQLKEAIKSQKPDILHAHAMFFCGLPAIFLGKRFGLPVIYEVRSLWMLKKKGRKGLFELIVEKTLFKIEVFVMRKARCVIAINESLKIELKKKINPNKIIVINNAVNIELVKSLKNKTFDTKSVEHGKRFGYIGTLTPHEGIDMLIDAFISINTTYPGARLSIFGDGIEAKNIQNISDKIENVKFHGKVHPNQIHKAFDTIDIIVNPRYKNKLTDSVTPLKPLEAMAYDKIVIGSDVGGIKELITNEYNGFLFKAGDKADLVATMDSVLKLEDRKKKEILKNAQLYVLQEKSWAANALAYKVLYEKVSSDIGY